MIFYLLRRLAYTMPIAIGVSIVCFSLIHLAPGDPLQSVIPEGATAEAVAQIREAYGFDKPLPVQYLLWLVRILQGDFGVSIVTRRPVLAEVAPAIVNTLTLSSAAILLGFAAGITLGLVAGYNNGTWIDRAVTALSVTGVSVPHYWLGMVLVVVFAVNLGMLPAMGMGAKGSKTFALDWESMRHLILPAIAMSVIPAGIIARSVRGTVAEVLKQDYVQTLHAKGLPGRRVFVHVAKNAAPTVLAIMGLQLAQLLGGSILIETVFSWPGTGFLLNTAIFTRDLPILQGTILVLAMFFVTINLLVDVLQTAFDPRIKRA
jgi:peptide/nickel transport system permease protein